MTASRSSIPPSPPDPEGTSMTRAFKILRSRRRALVAGALPHGARSSAIGQGRAAPPRRDRAASATSSSSAAVVTVKPGRPSPGSTATTSRTPSSPRQQLQVEGARHRRSLLLHFRQARPIRLFLLPSPAHDGQGRRQGVRRGTGRKPVKTFAPSLFTRRACGQQRSGAGPHRPAPAKPRVPAADPAAPRRRL